MDLYEVEVWNKVDKFWDKYLVRAWSVADAKTMTRWRLNQCPAAREPRCHHRKNPLRQGLCEHGRAVDSRSQLLSKSHDE